MQTAKYNLAIQQGANYEESFNLKDASGNPLPLSGYTARMQIRPYRTSDEVLIEATTENAMIFINAALGRIELNFSATATQNLIYSKSVYDLFLTNASGYKTKILEGDVLVGLQITRD